MYAMYIHTIIYIVFTLLKREIDFGLLFHFIMEQLAVFFLNLFTFQNVSYGFSFCILKRRRTKLHGI